MVGPEKNQSRLLRTPIAKQSRIAQPRSGLASAQRSSGLRNDGAAKAIFEASDLIVKTDGEIAAVDYLEGRRRRDVRGRPKNRTLGNREGDAPYDRRRHDVVWVSPNDFDLMREEAEDVTNPACAPRQRDNASCAASCTRFHASESSSTISRRPIRVAMRSFTTIGLPPWLFCFLLPIAGAASRFRFSGPVRGRQSNMDELRARRGMGKCHDLPSRFRRFHTSAGGMRSGTCS